MNNTENQSAVARLMQQIVSEYEAAQNGLTGLAITASHKFITTRMENIGRCHEELKQLVGEQDAIALVAQCMEEA